MKNEFQTFQTFYLSNQIGFDGKKNKERRHVNCKYIWLVQVGPNISENSEFVFVSREQLILFY